MMANDEAERKIRREKIFHLHSYVGNVFKQHFGVDDTTQSGL